MRVIGHDPARPGGEFTVHIQVRARLASVFVWAMAIAARARVIGPALAEKFAMAGARRLMRWRLVGERGWRRFT